MREVLVSVPYDGEHGGVYRDEDGVWLSGVLGDVGGTMVERRATVEGVVGDRWVVGGLLPPGAERAVVVAVTGDEVEAECAGGAWVAVVERRLNDHPVVRFEDAAGRVVRPPEARAGEPVDVDDEPCPACGGTAWERFDDVLACTRCGHEERIGAFYPGDDDVPVDLAEVPPRPAFDLGEAAFPVYALEGTRPEVCGWSRDAVSVRAVTVRHEGVEVETEREGWEDPEPRARRELLGMLHTGDPWPERPIPGLALWLRRREREIALAAARAAPFALDLPVDGALVPFQGLRSGEAWALVGSVGSLQVTVAARGTDPERVRLRAL